MGRVARYVDVHDTTLAVQFCLDEVERPTHLADEPVHLHECPLQVDTMSCSEWGALPAGLILHVLESLTQSADVTSARGACAAWRTAHDRFATALAPTALPFNSWAVVAASFPALTALDLTHIATAPTALHALAGLTRLSSLTLPWGIVLSGDEAPLTGVRRLTAKGAFLQGPDPLAAFPGLTALDLSHGRGVGALASSLTVRLSRLRELRLARVGLRNEELLALLPACNQATLQVLDVSGNQCDLSAALPFLPHSLTELSADDCGRLDARSAAGLGRLTRLRLLSLAGCELGSGGVVDGQFLGACLGTFSDLTTLDLSRCFAIGDVALAALARLPCGSTIRTLRLTGCQLISDAGAAELSRMPALTDLDMEHCVKLTAAGLSNLHDGRRRDGGLRCLRIGQLPGYCRHCRQSSDACGCVVDLDLDPGPPRVPSHLTALAAPSSGALSECWLLGTLRASGGSLRSLDLRACILPLDDLLQAAAPSLTALTSVRLAESFFVGSGSVAALASVPTLTTVDLSHCYDLDGLVLGRLAALPCLEALVLRGCVGMRGLRPADWSRSSRLRYIDASFCGALTDDCAAALATCPALTTLQLDNCMSLTVDGIAAALTAPRLRRLSLSDCDCVAVSDALRVDRLSGSAITDLDLAGCETLSRSAVAALANCTALRRLDLRRCLKVEEADLEKLLLPSLPRLSELHVAGCRVSVGFSRRWRPTPSMKPRDGVSAGSGFGLFDE